MTDEIKDKIETPIEAEEKTIPVSTDLFPQVWSTISVKTVDGVKFITEAMEVKRGVVQRETVLSGKNIATATVFIPGVKLGMHMDQSIGKTRLNYLMSFGG
jgi:hypothetical protein